jgi:hypothetical protein
MALVLADRVLETTDVAGTGPATLLGSQDGYQTFSVVGDGNTTYYTIYDSAAYEWEVGIGTYDITDNKLARTTVLSSSNAGALVYFGSGTKDIFLDLPAEAVITSAGDVTGPASAVANNFVLFDGTTGKLIKDAGYNASAFATAAQGAKADTAVQPGSLGTAAYLTAGAALGVATLDSGGKVPTSQIPQMGDLNYQGTWNASTNTPTLASGVGTKGYYYVVSVAGTTNLDGIASWAIGDWAVYNGTAWQKIDNTDAVISVNGYTGTVVLTASDISGFGTMAAQNANSVAITGGAIDGATLGATTPSSSKFTTTLVGTDANFTDFPNAKAVFSQANTGSGHIYNMGLAGEGVATDVPGAGQWGVGVYGTGATAGATRGIGIVGDGHVGNTADTAAAIGVRGYATQTHSGGQNIGLYSQATGGASNYSLFMASGNIYSAVTQTWAVPDNETSALSIDTTGKAGILKIVTTDGAEKVTMSGGLNVTGTTTLETSLSGLAKLTSGVVSAATSGTDYAPATSGTSILYGNGSGGFSNVTIGTGVSFAGGTLSAIGSGGTVTSVTGTSPIASSGGATPAISISQATTSTDGYLSSTDWNTFNNKGSGTVTSVTGTAPVVSSGGATPAISMAAATTSVNGYLTSTDWNTFNGKYSTGGALGTPSSGTLTNCTADGTNEVGFKNIPQNSQSAAYTLVLADAGKHIYHPASDANVRTYTIPAASSVAYPIGTAITFVNLSASVVTIAITSDTMYLSSAGTTGSRSLAQYGTATALKVAGLSSAGVWVISGSGLT